MLAPPPSTFNTKFICDAFIYTLNIYNITEPFFDPRYTWKRSQLQPFKCWYLIPL